MGGYTKQNPRFSGLTDGEGCFFVVDKQGRGQRSYPAFSIGLRADGAHVLEQLQSEFGGKVYNHNRADRNPMCSWVVSRKNDLRGLIRYFDEFGLVVKAEQYPVWRLAVVEYLKPLRGRDQKLIQRVCQKLRSLKKYRPSPLRSV